MDGPTADPLKAQGRRSAEAGEQHDRVVPDIVQAHQFHLVGGDMPGKAFHSVHKPRNQMAELPRIVRRHSLVPF
jgi:methyl coenzyme M reductase gamma subunit